MGKWGEMSVTDHNTEIYSVYNDTETENRENLHKTEAGSREFVVSA